MTDGKFVSSLPPLERARAAYQDISLYSPNRAPCRMDLSDNTNLFGVPPAALAVITNANQSRVTRYPSLYSGELKAAIADYLGVPTECVVTGCGSDDVLDSAIRAFCEPGEIVATSDPSFAMVPLFAAMNGLQARLVMLTSDFDVDAEALVAASGNVTYVCSPNNPTGNTVSSGALEHVIQNARGIVVVDEAYAEFTSGTVVHRAVESNRLLVVRTMSKAFGLAGLRIGYAVGSPKLVAEVEKSRGPYKVSSLAEQAAAAALNSDRQWVRDRISEVIRNRDRFRSELMALGFIVLPSDSNFLLLAVPNATETAARMRAREVAVRPFPALPHIGDTLRISVGPWPMMSEALTVLQECVP